MTSPLPRDRAEAVAAERAGRKLRYVFFWGHKASPDGSVTASCLSQWWPAKFTVDGLAFATAEHYMMWGKARLFGDDAIAARVLAARSPGEAKRLGRQVVGFDEETWRAQRFRLVVEANAAKFGQHPDLGAFLAATRKRVLVEASPRDRIWGIGLGAANPFAQVPSKWRGENLLGFALMAVRDGGDA